MIPDGRIIESLSDMFHLSDEKQKDFITGLADAINYLAQNDFSRLVQILYRMDISESKLKEMLAMNKDQDAGLIIGRLLIEREKEKILSREQFKKNNNISEDEKW